MVLIFVVAHEAVEGEAIQEASLSIALLFAHEAVEGEAILLGLDLCCWK